LRAGTTSKSAPASAARCGAARGARGVGRRSGAARGRRPAARAERKAPAAVRRGARKRGAGLEQVDSPAALPPAPLAPQVVLPGNLELPRFRHLLIAFGGPLGLEDCLAHDKRLTKTATTDVFDVYLNTCPDQGSRTIRTEEAILISMAFLQTAVRRFGER
jgi:hypothetical protein